MPNSASPEPVDRIIVADDDPVAREYLVGLLRGHGYHVTSCESGADALKAAGGNPPSLMILDVVMEGMTGVEVCRVVKAGGAGPEFIPVVLLTTLGDPDSRAEGLRIGADDYVTKPYDGRELLSRVRNMIRIKRLHDEVRETRAKVDTLSMRDELTGLFNRRYLAERINEEFKRSERYREPLACALVDLDRFAEFNEVRGREVGDAALRTAAARLRAVTREVDILARYGDDEFMLLLPNTHLVGALRIAERFLQAMQADEIGTVKYGQALTASMGIALYPTWGISTRELLAKAATDALDAAKSSGGNRICVASSQTYTYLPS